METRKKNRLNGWDYSKGGMYFITICTDKENETIPKFVSSLKRFVNKEVEKNIFHRSYHDHIIRNEADYQHIWTYIDNNPLKWELDCYYH